VRVLHLTDPHLFADTQGSLRGRVTHDSLQRVIAHYTASAWRAQLVALTGDIVHDDSAWAYDHCRELISALSLPVLCIPGNHDVPELMRSRLPGPPFDYCGVIRVGAWLVVGIDTTVAGRAGGAISDAEFARLASCVADSDAEHVMVCLHHPPVPMGSVWLDSVGLDNRGRFLSSLQDLDRVRIAIFGHAHQAYDDIIDGVRIVGTPSTCRQFLPGSDEFAVDDKPPAYRRITLGAGGSIDTELIWVPHD